MSATPEAQHVDAQKLAAYAKEKSADALAAPQEQLGEQLFRTFLGAWENPQLRPQLLEKIGSAATTEEGAAQLRDHFTALIVDRVGAVTDASRLNLNAVAAQVLGVIMLRYVMKMEPIASVSEDELVAAFAPTVQRYLDAGSAPPK